MNSQTSDRPNRWELFDAVADGLILHDPDTGEILDINETYLDLLGYEYEELVGQSVEAINAPKHSVEEAKERIREARREGSTRFEWRLQQRDGDIVPAEVNLSLVEIDGEERVLACVRDISDLKAHQRAADRDRNRYRLLAERFPNGAVAFVNRELEYEFIAGELFERIDLSPEELEGKRVDEAFPEEIAKKVETGYRNALAGSDTEFDIETDDRILRLRTRPVYEDGSIVGAMGMSQDVTVERRQRHAIENARRKYLTLVEASPDPIVLVDVDTGEIVETNPAAAELFGVPQQELVGRSYLEQCPEDNADQYRRLFEHCTGRSCVCRELPDGQQIHVVDDEGDQIPVSLSTSSVELDDRQLVYAIVRDISEQVHYEEALEALNQTGQDLLVAETGTEIAEIVVRALTEVIDLTGASVYFFDETENVLEPATYSEQIEQYLDAVPRFEPDDSVAWRVFETREPVISEDIRTEEDVYNPDTPLRSEMIFPLGDAGVLLAGSTEPDVFDEHTVDLVELLAAKATAALDRLDRERSLRRHEQELETRNRQLETAARLNSQIREAFRRLLEAGTRTEIEATICTQLVGDDWIEFAWIGDCDPGTDRLYPRESAGDHRGYLEEFPWSIETSEEPAAAALRSGEPVVVDNVATNLQSEEWRQRAVRRNLKSVLAVPIRYENSDYGVLTVYTSRQNAFQGPIRSVLSEVGELVGYAINGVQRKEALFADQTTELEFKITDLSCHVLQIARKTDTRFQVEGMVPQEDGTVHLFATAIEGSVDRILDYSEDAATLDRARLVVDGEDPVVQLQVSDSFIGAKLAEYGLGVRWISADADGAKIVVDVPPTVDAREAVETIVGLYPDSELLAIRERDRPRDPSRTLPGSILDRLTDRQREAVELAYREGYFDSPKQASGQEVADEMELSSSAFHRHLRSAEREVFESLFGDEGR